VTQDHLKQEREEKKNGHIACKKEKEIEKTEREGGDEVTSSISKRCNLCRIVMRRARNLNFTTVEIDVSLFVRLSLFQFAEIYWDCVP